MVGVVIIILTFMQSKLQTSFSGFEEDWPVEITRNTHHSFKEISIHASIQGQINGTCSFSSSPF